MNPPTPERSVEDLIKRLNIQADMIQLGEAIAWGSDSAIMREAAETLQAERQKREEMVEEILKTVSVERDLTPTKKYWFIKGIKSVAKKYGITQPQEPTNNN